MQFKSNDYIVEVAHNYYHAMGELVCGTQFLKKEFENHIAFVLCSGEERGCKSTSLAGLFASMAITYTGYAKSVVEVGRNIFSKFDKSDVNTAPSMTIVKIESGGKVCIIEYGNPCSLLFSGNEAKIVDYKIIELENGISFKYSSFVATVEDRVVLVTKGLTLAGFATKVMPKGWGDIGVSEYVQWLVDERKYISAMNMSCAVVNMAYHFDLKHPKHDMSCATVYFRKPRKLLVCTGPPYNMDNDKIMAEAVARYDGDVIISGGSTSQLIARELNRELVMKNMRDLSGLPPSYNMEGIKMVTEGVLTLGKVKNVLTKLKEERAKGEGIDILFVNELLEHDSIDFIVGTKVNELHQNPNIPIELELRRYVISDIARLLETKFFKNVTKRYL